jgi:hypothetical protein
MRTQSFLLGALYVVIKMFSLFSVSDDKFSVDETEAPLTRFGSSDGKAISDPVAVKATRFGANLNLENAPVSSSSKITPTRPKRQTNTTRLDRLRSAKPRRNRINEMAHLHAEDSVPLWVLQKALPGRFPAENSEQEALAFR